MRNPFDEILEIRSKLQNEISIISQKVEVLDKYRINKVATVTDAMDLKILNQEFDRSDPRIVALMLETKSDSSSRKLRKNDGNDYQPFLINSDESLNQLQSIISNLKQEQKPFEFNFLYNIYHHGGGIHWTPIQIISDRHETNLFSLDATGDTSNVDIMPIFRNLIGESGTIHSYLQGGVQTIKGCAIFGIRMLNVFSNMTVLEKKQSLTERVEDLDPRFLTIAQSFRTIEKIDPAKRAREPINKPGKEFKSLNKSLEESSVIVSVKDKIQPQNRLFDRKFLKYLLAVQTNLEKTLGEENGEDKVLAMINNRMDPTQPKYNTYREEVKLMTTEKKAKETIESSINGFEIGAIIRTFSAEKREEFLDSLQYKIAEIAFDSAPNRGRYIRDIIESFPQKQTFMPMILKCFDDLNIHDASVIIPAFRNKTGVFVEHGEKLIAKATDLDGIADLVRSFDKVDQNNLIQETLIQLCMVEPKDKIAEIIDIIHSFDSTQRHHFIKFAEGLIKNIIETDKVAKTDEVASIILSFDKQQRHHFIKDAKNLIHNLMAENKLELATEVFKFFPRQIQNQHLVVEARSLLNLYNKDKVKYRTGIEYLTKEFPHLAKLKPNLTQPHLGGVPSGIGI